MVEFNGKNEGKKHDAEEQRQRGVPHPHFQSAFQSSSSLVRQRRRRGGPFREKGGGFPFPSSHHSKADGKGSWSWCALGLFSGFCFIILAGLGEACHQLMLTSANQHYDGIFVITLQGTPNADPHNDGRLDNFKEAWRKSCGKDPDIHVCPGVIDDRRGYGLTQSWLTCLQMARSMNLDVTMVFEDDARLFDDKKSSLNLCDAGKRRSKVWKDLPEDTFIAFLGGHTWTYAADQGEKKKERLGSLQLSQYLEVNFSYGTYGFAVPRRSLDTLLNTIKDNLAHGFIDEEGERETEFLSPEKSWYRKAREVGKKMYAIHPLSVWHESGFSNTWNMDRGSITGEEEDDGESGDEGWIRGIAEEEDDGESGDEG